MNHEGEEAGRGASTRGCDVFISYARGDRPKAAALATALEDRGLRVWWDPELRAGDPWAGRIEDAVEAALSVVVLWSAEAVESRWVNAEARVGLDANKLVPVCLDDAEPPLVFREIQWRSFAGWDGEGEPPGIEELVADIRAAIQRSGGTAGRPVGKPSRRRRLWRAMSAAAAGLVLGGAAVALDLWGTALERATDLVVWSGFPLPAVAMQVAAVGLAVLYLTRHLRRLWPLRAASVFRVFTWSLALALGVGVLYDWVQQSRSPKRGVLLGRIVADDLEAMRVHLLDTPRLKIPLASAPVDGDNGAFVLHFGRVFGDRPRRLVIEQAGCDAEEVAIGRREWRTLVAAAQQHEEDERRDGSQLRSRPELKDEPRDGGPPRPSRLQARFTCRRPR